MNKEFKQNILRAIKNNIVRVTYLSDSHYTYKLFGKNNKVLMVVDCYDGLLPRISIEINGKHAGHINHFAQTKSQMKDNFDIFDFELTAEEMGEIRALDNGKRFFNMSLEQQERQLGAWHPAD